MPPKPLQTFIKDGVPKGVQVFETCQQAYQALQGIHCSIALIDGTRNLQLLPENRRLRALERTQALVANTEHATDPRMSDLKNPSFELMQFGIQQGFEIDYIVPIDTKTPQKISMHVDMDKDDVTVTMRKSSSTLFFDPEGSKAIRIYRLDDHEDQMIWSRAQRAYERGQFLLWAAPIGYAVAFKGRDISHSTPALTLYPNMPIDRRVILGFRLPHYDD